MVFTKDQKNDIKDLVKDCLKDDKLLDALAESLVEIVSKKLSERFDTLEKTIEENRQCIVKLEEEKLNLRRKIDHMEQQSKLSSLKLHGVPEESCEDLATVLNDIFSKKMGVTTDTISIDYCYRINSKLNPISINKPRPIYIKFGDKSSRDKVFSKRRVLKGSKIIITEDLVKARYEILTEAKKKFGKFNVWSQGGKIFAAFKGKKHLLESLDDLKTV